LNATARCLLAVKIGFEELKEILADLETELAKLVRDNVHISNLRGRV
jgi:hypothetical protein